jgi:hypothetical protein
MFWELPPPEEMALHLEIAMAVQQLFSILSHHALRILESIGHEKYREAHKTVEPTFTLSVPYCPASPDYCSSTCLRRFE